MTAKSIFIVGMGPGLSWAVAEKFGQEGFAVGMVSRKSEKLEGYREELLDRGIASHYATADVRETDQLEHALHQLREHLPPVHLLFYNAAALHPGDILEETVPGLIDDFKLSVAHAQHSVKLLHADLKAQQGAVLLTGGGFALHPNPQMASLSLSKAGQRNLALQLHERLAGEGVYCGTLTVAGMISPDRTTHAPDKLAGHFWSMYQAREQAEVVV